MPLPEEVAKLQRQQGWSDATLLQLTWNILQSASISDDVIAVMKGMGEAENAMADDVIDMLKGSE